MSAAQSVARRPAVQGGEAAAPAQPASTGRRIRLTGQVHHGEVRVHNGGTARLSAIVSRDYLADARRAHAGGGTPTLDDPARSA